MVIELPPDHWLPGFNFNVEEWDAKGLHALVDVLPVMTSIAALSSEECCRRLNALGQLPALCYGESLRDFQQPCPILSRTSPKPAYRLAP
jgi:hypothetical protein